MKLSIPSVTCLDSYIRAVESGFMNMQLGFGDVTAADIQKDHTAYLDSLANDQPFLVKTPFGLQFKIYDHKLLWLHDGDEFLGSIALRFKMDPELEPVVGHIGIAISPHARNKGYGSKALKMAFETLAADGYKHVYYTASPDNVPSVKLAERMGGVFIERYESPLGFGPTCLYDIKIQQPSM